MRPPRRRVWQPACIMLIMRRASGVRLRKQLEPWRIRGHVDRVRTARGAVQTAAAPAVGVKVHRWGLGSEERVEPVLERPAHRA